jgi:nucleoid-associated protein YgaU
MRLSVTLLTLVLGLFLVVGCEQPQAKQEPVQDTMVYEVDDDSYIDFSEEVVTTREYTVTKGDTLYSIARKYYDGDHRRWKDIWEANMDQIPDKNKLKVGLVLVIPD